MYTFSNINARQALEKLKQGNQLYVDSLFSIGDTSKSKRIQTYIKGQHPYAIIVTCSDSRVIPESIFQAGIGDLFVIRVAGNVIDDHQLGSIEYSAGHLGCHLIVILGHTHCGAVDAAMNGNPDGYIKFITDEIKKAIGKETNERKACIKNVFHSKEIIEESLEIQQYEHDEGLQVISALYDIETGKVDFELEI